MYQHTQAGTLIRWLLTLSILLLVLVIGIHTMALRQAGILMPDQHDVLLRLSGAIFVVLVVLVLFHNLTVVVDHQFIRLNYGIGIIGKKIPLSEVSDFRPVTNKWWWGWGIRKIPGGWMWNISGLQAVELKLRSGRILRIGTNEPTALAAVVSESIVSLNVN